MSHSSAHIVELPEPSAFAYTLASRLPAFGQIDWTAQTGSTNADLLTQTREGRGANKPWLLGAHLQISGRGRVGRAWQNQPGAALMMSCAFDVHLPIAGLPALSPLAGLAACEGLRALLRPDTGRLLTVKWPNDLQWGQAKLAGLLVESLRNPGGPDTGHTIVIGIGLNLSNADVLSQALDRPIADWTHVDARPDITAADLACALASSFHQAVLDMQQEGFGAFVQRYAQVDALAGQAVNVIDQGRILQQGIAQGIDTQGRLQLATPDGIQPIVVGEISIRPQT
jgi:BirA family biotin operon repressor/biotin-[acetyl-CoA-carboxylase] ligase